MCSLKYLLLAALFQVALSAPPVVTNVKYSKRPVNVDGKTVDAHVFGLEFDSPVFVEKKNVTISGFGGYSRDDSAFSFNYVNFKGVLQGVQLPTYLDWFQYAYATLWQADYPVSLSCNGVKHVPDSFTPGPISSVPQQIFMGDTPDALAGFLATYYNIYELWPSHPSAKNRAVYIAFGEIADAGGSSYSQISTLGEKIKNGECQLNIEQIFNAENQQLTQTFSSANFTFANPPLCDNTGFVEQYNRYKTAVSSILKRKNVKTYVDAENALNVLRATDSWYGCETMAKKLALSNSTATINVTSTVCDKQPGTFGFDTDPCCSGDAARTQCCAKKNDLVSFKEFNSYRQLSLSECAKDGLGQVVGALQDYVEMEHQSFAKTSACSNILFNEFGVSSIDDLPSDLFSKMSQYINECENAIIGNGHQPECSSDADCYTKCLIAYGKKTGFCKLPLGQESDAFAKCINERADGKVAEVLLLLLDSFNTNGAAAIKTRLDDRLTENVCSGDSSRKYNGGWYKPSPTYQWVSTSTVNPSSTVTQTVTGNYPTPTATLGTVLDGYAIVSTYIYRKSSYDLIGSAYEECDVSQNVPSLVGSLKDNGCFFLPESKDSCTTDETCNWNYKPESLNQCSIARYYDNNMCGECTQGKCFDRSLKSLCAYSKAVVDEPSVSDSSECTTLGGTAWSDAADPSSPKYCLVDDGQQKLTQSQCLNSCYSGPNPTITRGCYNKNIAEAGACSNATNGAGYLSAVFDDSRKKTAFICTVSANSTSCPSMYGSAGFQWQFPYREFGSGANARSEEKDTMLGMLCEQSYCYNHDIKDPSICETMNGTSIDGKTYFGFMDYNLDNGDGSCRIGFKTEGSNLTSFRQACESVVVPEGYEPFNTYLGRTYRRGLFENQDECGRNGYCDDNPFIPPTECASTDKCRGLCQGCVSEHDGKLGMPEYAICVSSDLNQCLDDVRAGYGAKVDISLNKCIYRGLTGINRCSSVGGNILTCSSFSSSSCAFSLYQDYLQCSWGKKKCSGQAECEDKAGKCSDRYDFPNANGQCLFGFESDPESYTPSTKCPAGRTSTKIGCIDFSFTTSFSCSSSGGTWVRPATNKDECLTRTGCCESGYNCDLYLSSKNETECTACGGTSRSVYSWTSGVWERGSSTPVSWVRRDVTKQNIWTSALSVRSLKLWVAEAARKFVSEKVQAYLTCKSSQLFSALPTIACRCGINNDNGCLFSYGMTGPEILYTEYGCPSSKKVFGKGISLSLSTMAGLSCARNNLSVSFFPTTLVDGQTNLTTSDGGLDGGFDVSGLHKREVSFSTDTNSTDGKGGSGSAVVDNIQYIPGSATPGCYERVQNSFRAFVGQIRGDCYKIEGTIPQSGLQACLAIKPSILRDNVNFTIPAIAEMRLDEKFNAEFTVVPGSVTDNGDSFCFQVSRASTYCPASVIPGSSSVRSRSRSGACTVVNFVNEDVKAADIAARASAGSFVFGNLDRSLAAGRPFRSFNVFVNLPNNAGSAVAAYLPVSLSVVSRKDGVRLLGTARVNANNGVATFDDVSVSTAGSGYTLKVSGFSVPPVVSQQFQVNPGGAFGLRFVDQPKGAAVGRTFKNIPSVQVVDLFGNPFLQNTFQIDVTLIHLPSRREYAVTGYNSISTASGFAFLPGIVVDFAGSNFVLKASSQTLSPTYSEPFNIGPANESPMKLTFDTISQQNFNEDFTDTIKVKVYDSRDIFVPSASGQVTLSIGNTTRQDARLSGELTRPIIGGVATFSGVRVTLPGQSFNLLATSASLGSGISNSFIVIGPAAFEFFSVPSVVVAGEPFTIVVRCIDVVRNFYSRLPDEAVTISLRVNPVQASLNGETTVFTSGGIATFENLVIDSVGEGFQFRVLSTSEYLGLSKFFNVVEPGSLDTRTATSTDRGQFNSVRPPGSNQDQITGAKRSDVNPPLLGSIIGAACVGLATIIVFMYRMSVPNRPKRQKIPSKSTGESSSVSSKVSATSDLKMRNVQTSG